MAVGEGCVIVAGVVVASAAVLPECWCCVCVDVDADVDVDVVVGSLKGYFGGRLG